MATKKKMTLEQIDAMYDRRLEELYQVAVKKGDAGTAFVILEKIRVMKLHMARPDKNDKPPA